jgi:alkylation response protein AidB-like acyl-CoA dehydrogenase
LYEHAGELHGCERAGVQVSAVSSVDRARRLARVSFTPSAETRLASGERAGQLLAAAYDHAALGTAAQLVGLGAHMLELTASHVKTRKQFGQAIGAFQAVKHQLVDAHLALEFAGPLVYRAAHSVAHHDPERSLHISMAKAFASDAALLAARTALQLHGAIGYSYEYELQLFMKRAWALAAAYGDAREHRQRLADVMLVASDRARDSQGERHV